MKLFTLTIIALSLVLATGCAVQPKLIGAQANATADAIVTDLADAQSHLVAARPHADTIGQPHIDAAAKSAASASGRVAPLHQQIDQLTAIAVKFQDLWTHSWFGGKSHALFWKIVLVLGLTLAAGVAVEVFTSGGAGAVVNILRLVTRELAGALPFIGGRFMAWAKNREHALALEAAKVEAFFAQK